MLSCGGAGGVAGVVAGASWSATGEAIVGAETGLCVTVESVFAAGFALDAGFLAKGLGAGMAAEGLAEFEVVGVGFDIAGCCEFDGKVVDCVAVDWVCARKSVLVASRRTRALTKNQGMK